MKPTKLLVGLAALALATPVAVAHAAPAGGVDRFEKVAKVAVDPKVLPASLDDSSTVKVMVELGDAPVAVEQAKAKRTLSASEKQAIRTKIGKKQDGVAKAVKAKGGTVVSQMQDAYNGVHVQVKRSDVAGLAQLPDVKALHAVRVFERTNAVSVPYLGAPQVWESTGYTGEGVKVAILDTGVDYTHATFGGPGTVEAFKKAAATSAQPADPALFGPDAPRVKGGWDLVGDAYNPSKSPIPQPDANPLDCQGHGTHVAGTAAGGGVTADGAAYTGPYDSSTAQASWKVGPGVAPQADVYAYRVFGCTGGTDVATEAIDRAVKDGVDVINMSLGSAYGRADDPTAVASANAVGAGVVVVASAGNDGPNPYLTGSPATGHGVISVTAMDSTPTFPGAELSFDGQKMAAINANGVDPLPAGPFTIVNLVDDPATPDNEALGCSTEAFTKNGVAEGKNQIAVTQRGVCARVAKAVWGQKAGAAAVVIVNNADTYPPYEGTITENPDTGEQYQVTIPLLGVRSSDGPALKAADGKSLTLASAELANPGFTAAGSFSSGGPRNGDSGLRPSISAPGVATASAAVGSGNDVAVMSGTSMAAPHVAGVAALGVQAHPGWPAQDVAASIVNTGDPEKMKGYRLTLGGTGIVDIAQVVGTRSVALGDSFETPSGIFLEPALSFGFAESTGSFTGTKKVTIVNNSDAAVTYTVANEATRQSRPATVKFSSDTVTVPAHGRATVDVTLTAPMKDVGSALTGGFAFREVSGSVKLTAGGETLRVPYLLVPRADSNVTAVPKGQLNPRTGGVPVTFTNKAGAVATGVDLYQWGLQDGRDVDASLGGSGFDLRAAGVQAFDEGDDKLLVFALNTWDRYSNAAVNSYDVVIDNDNDGTPDWVVFSLDFGAVTTGYPDGRPAVFLYDLATKELASAGFLAVAPTDNSTVLLPVMAADVGVKGAFTYQVQSSTIEGPGTDVMDGVATFDPWRPAIVQAGGWVPLPANGAATQNIVVDAEAKAHQKPLGLMGVVFDNQAGEREALLLPTK